MKTIRFLFLFSLITIAGLGFYGCEEDTTQPPDDTHDHAEILLMHAAPAGPGVDLLIDDSVYVTNATFGQFGTAYAEIEAGSRRVRILPTGTTASPVIDETLDFTKDEHYTLFILNDAAPLVFQDNLSEPAAGKAHIRIAHLIPDGPEVKLSFQGSGLGPIFDNIEFKENTEFFTPVNAEEVVLRVQKAGSSGGGGGGGGGGGSEPIAPDLSYTLEDGGIYTIAIIGTVAATDDHDPEIVVIKHEEDHE